jgi:glycosyltransferase involved in cell wall biosynthesis
VRLAFEETPVKVGEQNRLRVWVYDEYFQPLSDADVKIQLSLPDGTKKNLAAPLENAWLDIADRVFVGSEFMRHDLLQKRSVAPGKVHATGFPLDPLVKVQPRRGKRALVVFTGRDHPEKQPHLWQQLKRSFSSGVEFVWTMENGGLSRSDYLELLSHARVIVSFALQENFGFALREAAALGCVPIVPDRLVYPECFADPYRYKTFSDCVWKVNDALKDKLVPPFVDDREFEVPGAWFA